MVKLRGQGMMKKAFLPGLEFEEPESQEQAWFSSALLPSPRFCVLPPEFGMQSLVGWSSRKNPGV